MSSQGKGTTLGEKTLKWVGVAISYFNTPSLPLSLLWMFGTCAIVNEKGRVSMLHLLGVSGVLVKGQFCQRTRPEILNFLYHILK